MYYEEKQLTSILICPKCNSKFNEPKVLPCGHLICLDCICDMKKLVRSLDTFEFHCQSCNQFHELEDSTEFMTCQPILNILTCETPIELKRPCIELSKLESALLANDVDVSMVSEYCLKLRTDLTQTFNDSIARIHALKASLIDAIDRFQSDCEESFNQLKEFEYESNLSELRDLHSKWQKAVDDIQFTDIEMNEVDELTNGLVHKLDARQKEFRNFIIKSDMLPSYSQGLNEIKNDLLEHASKYSIPSATNNLKLVNELIGHTDSVYTVVVLSGYKIASGSCDGAIRIWDGLTGFLESTINIHSTSINSLVGLSKNRIASGSWDNTIKIANLNTGKCLQTLTGHTGVIYALEVLESDQLASGSYDGSIKVWDTSKVNGSGALRLTINGNAGGVYCLAALSSNKLASGFQDGIRIWDIATGELLSMISGHADSVNALVKLSDAEFASGSWDQTIMIWDTETGELRMTLIGHSDEVTSLAKLPLTGDLVSGSMDGFIRVWNCQSGEIKSEAQKQSSSLYKVCVLPNGQIVSGWEDRTIKIYGFE